MELNHFDGAGNAIMVDVSGKAATHRRATAQGFLRVTPAILEAIAGGTAAKGDVLGVARVAGIMATKRTAELIPLCHPLSLTHASVDFDIAECGVTVTCTAEIDGKTGVEMEALTGATVALLTLYDMCKAMDKGMVLENVHLLSKSGGKSGDYTHE